MKKIILLVISCTSLAIAFAQKETFDIVTYTSLKGWEKQPAESAVQFSKEDTAKGTYCMITLFKAVPGTANSKENFDLAWASVVKEMVTASATPEMQPVATEDGWEVQSGYAPFENDGIKGIVVLVTSSGFEKMVNIIILTNTDTYEKNITAFLESVSLKKPEVNSQTATENNSDNLSIIGTWGKNSGAHQTYGDPVSYGNAGYSKDQYTFNSNGTYSFVSKTFRMSYDKIILVKENGTYQISGTNLTIQPKKSVIEAWSKKDGSDKWGKLLTTQPRTIEKVTYSFTKHYFSGIQIWNLVLQADKVTQRDGPFSTNTTFTNAWYYGPISSNNPVIELPAGQHASAEELKKEPVQQLATSASTPILGTWGIGTTTLYSTNTASTAGTTMIQYTFMANGTYHFYTKTFRYHYDKLLLTKENGTYQISGSHLTITPQKSVTEAWSKKGGTDNWGKLLSSQKRIVEQTTYQFFTKDFGSGLVLVLQADKVTERDGPFNNSDHDAWFYPSITSSLSMIQLPG